MDYYDFLNKGVRALDSLMLEDKFDYNPQAIDKEQMMMDFYFLSGITSFVPDIISGIEEVDLQDAMKTARQSITSVVKQDLLDAVFEAICIESVHLADAVNIEDDPDDKGDLLYHYVDLIKSGKSGQEKIFFPSQKKDIDGFNITVDYKFDAADEIPFTKYFQDIAAQYNERSEMVEIDPTKRRQIVEKYFEDAEFVELMMGLFSDPSVPWDQRYGGGMWGVVCQGWKRLYESRKPKDNIENIDILFSLQHNNGAVLDKVKSYANVDQSHAWIKKALDFKFNNKDFWNYYDKISPSLKRLAGFATKSVTGKTFEQLRAEQG